MVSPRRRPIGKRRSATARSCWSAERTVAACGLPPGGDEEVHSHTPEPAAVAAAVVVSPGHRELASAGGLDRAPAFHGARGRRRTASERGGAGAFSDISGANRREQTHRIQGRPQHRAERSVPNPDRDLRPPRGPDRALGGARLGVDVGGLHRRTVCRHAECLPGVGGTDRLTQPDLWEQPREHEPNRGHRSRCQEHALQ